MISFIDIEADSSKISERLDQNDELTKKTIEMYRIKNKLFDYIHRRIRSYGKSHTSQKLKFYKINWFDIINRSYFDKETKVIKGDLGRLITELKDEIGRVRSLSKKRFCSEFSHKRPKNEKVKKILKDIIWERSDENVRHYTSVPLRGIVKDLI